jgi:two-component system NtrC family response regulator
LTEQNRKLLIVEDDPGLLSQLKWCFEDYDVATAEDRTAAITELRRHDPMVVLQDLGLPPNPEGVEEGLATLQELLKLSPHTKVIVVTGHGDQENALKSVALGAYDFYQKPVDTDTLQLLVERAFNISELESENRRLQSLASESPLDGIVAASEGMLSVCRMIEKVAPTNVTTLLLGESGTGKELLARALHNLSPRKEKKFVAINCAAIPENLLESELFGHEKGAFTGAVKQTPGKIEIADGGTLFLDEIGDMPLPLQARSTCGSSAPPTRIRSSSSNRASSAKTCITASAKSRSTSRRIVTARRAGSSSPGIFLRVTRISRVAG